MVDHYHFLYQFHHRYPTLSLSTHPPPPHTPIPPSGVGRTGEECRLERPNSHLQPTTDVPFVSNSEQLRAGHRHVLERSLDGRYLLVDFLSGVIPVMAVRGPYWDQPPPSPTSETDGLLPSLTLPT